MHARGKRMSAALLAVAVVALLIPGVALATGWKIIGQGVARGKFTVAAASGTAIRPTAVQMKVTASPNIRTAAGYSIQCRKGSRKKKGTGKAAGMTPITKAVSRGLSVLLRARCGRAAHRSSNRSHVQLCVPNTVARCVHSLYKMHCNDR